MIHFLFILNFLICISIAIFLIINFFKYDKNLPFRRAFFLSFLIGVSFLAFSIVLAFWILDVMEYASNDLLLIQSIIAFIETILLIMIIYFIRRNKSIFYLLFTYLIYIPAIFLRVSFFNFILISSLLIMMVLFIILISSSDFVKSSKFAIFYCSVSLIFQLILLFKNQFFSWMSPISNIFFFAFIFFFLSDLKKLPPILIHKKQKYHENTYLFDFLRYFVFILILTNFIFIGVLGIHEGGHFFVSKMIPECNLEKIVYDGNLLRTEILCGESINDIRKVLLGGIGLPLLVALLFLFGGGTFMKEVSLLIVGFDILISYKDFIDLGFSQIISTFFSTLGALILIVAIAVLAKSRTLEEEFIHLDKD